MGVLDFDALYVNPTFLGPQVVGGLIFGVGFVVGGYCPGTSIVAAVTGKLDAVVFLAGAGAGVLVFAGVYDRSAVLRPRARTSASSSRTGSTSPSESWRCS